MRAVKCPHMSYNLPSASPNNCFCACKPTPTVQNSHGQTHGSTFPKTHALGLIVKAVKMQHNLAKKQLQ